MLDALDYVPLACICLLWAESMVEIGHHIASKSWCSTRGVVIAESGGLRIVVVLRGLSGDVLRHQLDLIGQAARGGSPHWHL